MRITKRQLRRIIHEEMNRLSETPNWKPLSGAHAEELGEKPLQSESMDSMVAKLKQAINNRRASAESLWEIGQVYIMTGEAEGITVQVVQRGRPRKKV